MSAHSSQSHHHILPLRTYLNVFMLLLVLTAVTVGVALVDFGPLNIVIAMLVAITKAAAVALIFMHLKYDNKLYLLAFLTSIICLGIFIAITLVDTDYRGRINAETTAPIIKQAVLPSHSDTAAAQGSAPTNGTSAMSADTSKTSDSTATGGVTDTTKPAPAGGH